MFEVERLGFLSVVAVPRRLNVTHVRGLVECVRAELAEHPRAIVLDLRGTDAIDMAGLAGIVEMHKHCANRGVQLRLSAPRQAVRRLLGITRLDRALHLDEGTAEGGLSAAAE